MKASIINVLGNIAGYIFMALLLGILAIMAILPIIGAIALWQCLVGML